MKQLKNWILGWILYHANRYSYLDVFSKEVRLRPLFYEIKNQILQKEGKHICYDLQVIDSQECHTCEGTGLYRKYNHYDNYYYREPCWHCCGTGVYKDGSVIVLAKVKLGGYTFHQPKLRTYFKKDAKKELLMVSYKAMYETDNLFEGYINKKSTAFSLICLYLIFRLHGKKQEFWRNIVIWWRDYYWLPRNYIRNIFYLRQHKKLPSKKQLLYIFEHFRDKIKRKYPKIFPQKSIHQKRQEYIMQELSQENDLPF